MEPIPFWTAYQPSWDGQASPHIAEWTSTPDNRPECLPQSGYGFPDFRPQAQSFPDIFDPNLVAGRGDNPDRTETEGRKAR